MLFWVPIEDESQLLELVRGERSRPFAILKHSDRCSISFMAKSRLEKTPDERIDYFILNVINRRSLSDLLAELTGQKHESPQIFLFEGGKLLLCKSHMSIRPGVISDTLNQVLQ